MNIYVDLSFLIALFNNITAYAFTRKLKSSKTKKISTILFLIFSSFSVCFYRCDIWWIPLIYLLILNLFYFCFFIKDILIHLFFYFCLIGMQMLFKNHLFINNFLALALDIYALGIVLLININSLVLRVIFIKLIRYFKNQKYVYSVDLIFENKHLKLKAYYDSGNCMTFDSIPVVFIKDENIKTKTLSTIKYQVDKLKDGEIIVKNKRKIRRKVKVSKVSSAYDFNGCECLLNALLL